MKLLFKQIISPLILFIIWYGESYAQSKIQLEQTVVSENINYNIDGLFKDKNGKKVIVYSNLLQANSQDNFERGLILENGKKIKFQNGESFIGYYNETITLLKDNKEEMYKEVITKKLIENNLVFEKQINTPSNENHVEQTKSGYVLVADQGEWGTTKYIIYNNNLDSVTTYDPYGENFDFSSFDFFDSKIFFGSNPLDQNMTKKVCLIDAVTGNKIFENQIGENGSKIYKVKALKSSYICYLYSDSSKEHSFIVFNGKGDILSIKKLTEPVLEITQLNDSNKIYIVGTTTIMLFNIKNNAIEASFNFKELDKKSTNRYENSFISINSLNDNHNLLTIAKEYDEKGRNFKSIEIFLEDENLKLIDKKIYSELNNRFNILSNQEGAYFQINNKIYSYVLKN